MARRKIKEPADLPPDPSNENAEIAKTGKSDLAFELAQLNAEIGEKPVSGVLRKAAAPETDRESWSQFLTVTGLGLMAGCGTNDLARVAAKELIDNGYDASTAYGVEVAIVGRTLVVRDFGEGLAEDRVLNIFNVRRSSLSTKRWRKAQRGALGNGTRVIMGVAFVSGGSVTVESHGIGQELVVDADGQTRVRRHFTSDIEKDQGTRVSLTYGPQIDFDPAKITAFAERASSGKGTAFGGKAVPSWFDARELHALFRDMADWPVREIALRFDLTEEAFKAATAAAPRMNAGALLRDQERLDAVTAIILGGQKSARDLLPMGKKARTGTYATETTSIRLGAMTATDGVVVPAIVECWVSGSPVADKKADGAVSIGAIFTNRTPAIMDGEGLVRHGTKDMLLWLGDSCFVIPGQRGPCNYDIDIAITVPELPMTGNGKQTDMEAFEDAVVRIVEEAAAKEYKRPSAKAVVPATSMRVTFKDAIWGVIAEGVEALGGKLRWITPRSVYYAIRGAVLGRTALARQWRR